MFARFDRWFVSLLLLMVWTGSASLAPAGALHPFYISVTEINHNAAEKTWEVSCKVFVEDLEETIKKQHRTAVDLASTAQHERAGVLVNQYIQQHLRLVANGKPVALRFIGFEKESESAYCYFEGAAAAPVSKLEVENSVLHDFTAEQINIMHVTVAGRRQSTRLTAPAKTASFSF